MSEIGLDGAAAGARTAAGAAARPGAAPGGIWARLRPVLGSVWTLILAIPLLIWLLDPAELEGRLIFALEALGRTAPYIAVATLMIAWLKAASAEAVIARAFEGAETRMIVAAALFGALAPFCSCQVIPFIAALLAMRASLPAVMAFWLSSPLIDPPQLMITAGALGWDFAIGKAVAAVALGLMGGFAMRALVGAGAFAEPLRERRAGGCCAKRAVSSDARPVWRFWGDAARRRMFREEAASNALFLLKWLTFAYLLESLLVRYAPAEWIGGLVGGDGFGSIALGALIGAPTYLNGYAAPAVIAGLMEQGMSDGAAMAFMTAGAVSSLPAMAAVWSLVRPGVFAAYLGFGIFGAMAIGAAFAAVV